MIIAPWSTHLSITFLFSGSDGVNLGPPGISTCENICFWFGKKVEDDKLGNLVNIGNLLMGLIDRVTIVDQNWHSACRVHVSQVLDTLTKKVSSLLTQREG